MKHTKEDDIQEIIRISGVSRSTIFRYLAGKGIRSSSRECIEEAMQMLQGREGKQRLAPATETETQEIIVSINTTTFDQFQGNSEALAGVMEEAGNRNVHIRLERDMQADRFGKGVIVLGKHDPEETQECELLKALHKPFVVINRMIEDPCVSYVASDVNRCAYDVCTHLLSTGKRRILFWGEQETRVSRDKFRGYRKALQDQGIPFDPSLVFDEKTPLEEVFSRFSQMQSRPDALLCMDDETATVAIRLAVEQGLRIPKEFSISGMNDLGSSKSIIPSLTSVRIPFRKLGTLALRTVLELMNNPFMKAAKITVCHDLVIRDSTRLPS
ncbi:MAG: LacI family transcriptional regulator [Sphaerochaeta sp.]|jgi:LacI family transcriptional regulator|nr:LacI family transcriptional regulator [Sphaerochaeta sp.]MCH3920990.1 LacI family transcriptional regulator [Sphaerochaeta sp.]MCI2045246.1 LacI family transcriptional regulator [Sphaerochaeta sp.]MCI2075873.1 LacI family transcriptional regulator [Sphaerochaeta sp.]MCI2097139.1 LacI family transcriptional regulator [Sphaerochaeta sp.]